MATFISLINWTEKGISEYSDSSDRAKAAADLAEKMGGAMTQIFWTLGAYDIVAVTEFADDETATAYALKLGALGNVRTTTLRGFSQTEFEGIVQKTI